MKSVRKSVLVPYSPTEMFELVSAVPAYPQFLPWCLGARVNMRKEHYLEADVIVGYKMFR